MKVKVATSLRCVDEFEMEADNIKTILNYLKMVKGEEYTRKLMENNFKYILIDSHEKLQPVGLVPEVLFGEFAGYDTLYIIHEVCGEGTAIVIALGVAGSVAGAVTAVGAVVAAIINIVISIAISFIISLLSPTPEFSSDPSQSVDRKQSSLFNGAPLIREQGGIVPIVLGNPFAGGVLISSGVSTEDTI